MAIDEEGETAAAYTVMMEAGAAMPPDEKIDFTLDRPFVFAITSQDGSAAFHRRCQYAELSKEIRNGERKQIIFRNPKEKPTMKKMIAMILALACVFSFAACASKKTDDTIGAESPSTSEQQTQTPSEDAAAEEQPSDDASW
ncbi:MAG: hypothetical protein ACLR8U_00460 [Oscillospiraceae bacterium]